MAIKTTYDRVLDVISSEMRIPRPIVVPETTLEELGIDEIWKVQIAMELEIRLGIEIPENDAYQAALTLAQFAKLVDDAEKDPVTDQGGEE